jgi:hypothetical protein
MAKDIQSLYVRKEGDDFINEFNFNTNDDKIYSEDQKIILTLTTTSSLNFYDSFPSHSINIVKYLLQKNNGSFILIRKQKNTVQTRWQTLELADNIEKMQLKFVSQEGQEFDDWNSEHKDIYGDALPALIKIKLVIKEHHLTRTFEYFIPVGGTKN